MIADDLKNGPANGVFRHLEKLRRCRIDPEDLAIATEQNYAVRDVFEELSFMRNG